MSEIWNDVDIAILKEQYPTIFMFEDLFTDEELAELEEE